MIHYTTFFNRLHIKNQIINFYKQLYYYQIQYLYYYQIHYYRSNYVIFFRLRFINLVMIILINYAFIFRLIDNYISGNHVFDKLYFHHQTEIEIKSVNDTVKSVYRSRLYDLISV